MMFVKWCSGNLSSFCKKKYAVAPTEMVCIFPNNWLGLAIAAEDNDMGDIGGSSVTGEEGAGRGAANCLVVVVSGVRDDGSAVVNGTRLPAKKPSIVDTVPSKRWRRRNDGDNTIAVYFCRP